MTPQQPDQEPISLESLLADLDLLLDSQGTEVSLPLLRSISLISVITLDGVTEVSSESSSLITD